MTSERAKETALVFALCRRRDVEPTTRYDLWRATTQSNGGVFVMPNDGRVHSGQHINAETFDELFERVPEYFLLGRS